jgi:alpha-1,2-mannosyltransferase
MENKHVARILAAAAIVLAVALSVTTVYRSGPHTMFGRTFGSKVHRTDFTVYHEAGRAVLDGRNIYEVANPRGWVYQYLPVFSILMVPLALLSVFWASLIWCLLSEAMVAHTVWLSVKMARRFWPEHRVPDAWLAAGVVALLAWPIISGIERGQASPLIAWLVTLAIWFVLQRRCWWSGAALAAAVVLKIFPALLLPFLAWKRQWLALAAALVWLALLVWGVPSLVFGVRGNQALLRQWWTTVARPANEPEQAAGNRRFGQMIDPRIDRNQSVQAVTIRWFGAGRERLARAVAAGINLALLAVSAWAVWRGVGETRRLLAQFCVAVLLMLAMAPVSWLHNFVLMAVPLTVAVVLGFGCGAKPMRIAVILFAAAMIAARAVPVCHSCGALLVGTLVVWGAFVCLLVRKESTTSLV